MNVCLFCFFLTVFKFSGIFVWPSFLTLFIHLLSTCLIAPPMGLLRAGQGWGPDLGELPGWQEAQTLQHLSSNTHWWGSARRTQRPSGGTKEGLAWGITQGPIGPRCSSLLFPLTL